MRQHTRVLVAMALGVVVGACVPPQAERGAGPTASPRASAGADDTVTVGSFDFVESNVLGEIYAQALERQGIRVERAFNLSSREIVEPALEEGLLDLVPEYLGTALEFLNKGAGEASADAQVTHTKLKRAFAERGVTTLAFARAQNQNRIAVTAETARRYDLAAVSDLIPIADELVFGGPPECPERPYCMRGLSRVYGLAFEEFKSLDAGGPLTMAALDGGEIDVGLLFSNDTAAGEKGVVFLDDDRKLQPAENIVPVVRSDVVAEHGQDLVGSVDRVTEHLATEELVPLIRAAESGEPVRDIVGAWLDREGL